MPPTTLTEKYENLRQRLEVLSRELGTTGALTQQEIARILKDLAELKQEIKNQVEKDTYSAERIAVLETTCSQLEKRDELLQKRLDDAEQRRWQLIVAMLACFFTGGVALIVAITKR